MKLSDMNKQKIVQNALVITGISAVMFVLLLLTSNKIYVFGQMVPFEVVDAVVIIGIIGIPFYVINKTPLKYIIFSPVIHFLLLLLSSPPTPTQHYFT